MTLTPKIRMAGPTRGRGGRSLASNDQTTSSKRHHIHRCDRNPAGSRRCTCPDTVTTGAGAEPQGHQSRLPPPRGASGREQGASQSRPRSFLRYPHLCVRQDVLRELPSSRTRVRGDRGPSYRRFRQTDLAQVTAADRTRPRRQGADRLGRAQRDTWRRRNLRLPPGQCRCGKPARR